MENKVKKEIDRIDLSNEICDISCQVELLEFVQNSIIELHQCTPAILMNEPFDKIKTAIENIYKIIEDAEG